MTDKTVDERLERLATDIWDSMMADIDLNGYSEDSFRLECWYRELQVITGLLNEESREVTE